MSVPDMTECTGDSWEVGRSGVVVDIKRPEVVQSNKDVAPSKESTWYWISDAVEEHRKKNHVR